MKCIGWNASANDKGNRDQKAFSRIPSLAIAGNVIMLHDILPRKELKTAFLSNLRRLFENIKSRNLNTLSIDRFFSIPAYREEKLF
jgi:hypothetical protein